MKLFFQYLDPATQSIFNAQYIVDIHEIKAYAVCLLPDYVAKVN